MAGPWEDFAAPESADKVAAVKGPWSDFQSDPGLVSAVKRTGGQMAESTARTAEDVFGKNKITDAIQNWGRDVQAENPAGIGSLSDIAAHPLLAVKEGVGNMAAQMPVTLLAGGAGQAIGTGIGGLVAGPPGAAIGGTIGRWAGALVPTFAQEYGGIRKEQDEQGIDDKGRAAMAAVPATAIEFNPLSPEVGMLKLMGKNAGKQLFGQGGKQMAKDLGKAAIKGAIGEGPMEEYPQTMLEAWGAHKDPLSPEVQEEGAVASILAAIGGGTMGPITATVSGMKYAAAQKAAQRQREQEQAAQDQEQNPLLALPAPVYTGTPSDQLIGPAVDQANAVADAERRNAEMWAERDAAEQARKEAWASLYPNGEPVITGDVAGLQQQIDNLLGIDQTQLKGIQRTHYVNALNKLLAEPIGIGHDENGLERPVTMGEYLDNQVTAEAAVRARLQQRRDAANQSAQTRIDQVASEETAPGIDTISGPMTSAVFGKPVVVSKDQGIAGGGPLARAANAAVQTGASAALQQAATITQTGANAHAAQTQQVAQEAQKANDAQAQAQPAAAQATAFDVSTRTEPQLVYLSQHGQSGWKEAAAAELQKRGIPVDQQQTAQDQATAERKPAKPVEKWTAEEIQSRLDRGNLTPESEQKLRDLLASKKPEATKPTKAEGQIKVGNTPSDAQPLTVRNGVVHIGDEPVAHFETGENVSVPEDATPQQIADAVKSSGALGKRKIFGVTPMPQAAGKVSKAEVAPAQSAQQSDQGADHGQGQKAEVLTKTGAENETTAPAKLENATAPEHVQTGVDDRELGEIVDEFNQAQTSMVEDGEKITHVFDAPAKNEIVRINDKVKVYHNDHGWMTPAEAKANIEEWKRHAEAQGKDPKTRIENSDKVVLSLFDLSGKWSQPWVDAGYQVYRFDIQDDPVVGDVHNFSTEFFGDWFGDFEGKDIYAVLAACPCTDFASSGARHFAAKDNDGRTVASVKLVHQTLNVIEYFKPQVWAIENPVGRIESLGGLPPWRLSFDPNAFGEDYTKKTLLWGRFNGDLPIAPTEATEGSKMHRLYGGKSIATKNARSETPEGFAYAFFMANNAHDHPAMAIANKFDRLDGKLIEQAVEAGITKDQIENAVEDLYYMELDDEGANQAIRDLIDNATPPAGKAKGGEEAPVSQQKTDAAPESLQDQAPAQPGREKMLEGRIAQVEAKLNELLAKQEQAKANKNDWVYEQQIIETRRELISYREALDKLRPPQEKTKLERLAEAKTTLANLEAENDVNMIHDDRRLERIRNFKKLVANLEAEIAEDTRTATPEEAKQAEPVAAPDVVVAPEWADKVAQKNGYAIVGQNNDGWALFEKDGNRIRQETARKQPKPASYHDQITVPWSDTPQWDSAYSTPDELAVRHGKLLEYAQHKVGDKVIFTNFGGKQTVGTVESVKANASVTSVIGLNPNGGLGVSRGTLNPNITYTLVAEDGKKIDYASQEMVQAFDESLIKGKDKGSVEDYQKVLIPAGSFVNKDGETYRVRNDYTEGHRKDGEPVSVRTTGYIAQVLDLPYASVEVASTPVNREPSVQPAGTPDVSSQAEAATVPDGISIGQFKHTKTGVPQYSVSFKDRVERDVFDRAKQIAGGYGVKYSAFRGYGAIPGFLFMNEAKANEFAQEIGKLVEKPAAKATEKPAEKAVVERQPAEYESKAAALFAAMDDNAQFGVQFGMFPAPLMAQAESEGYTDTQALTTNLMAEWRRAQQKPAKIEMPDESATLKAKETRNADAQPAQAGNDDQGISGIGTSGNVSSSAGEQGTGRTGDESGQRSTGNVQRPDGPVDGRSAGDESGRTGNAGDRADAISDNAREPDRRIGAGANARISERNSAGRNYLAPTGALERKGSWLETAKRNVEIIKLVKRLGSENRLATADEQALIAQYVGFGASDLANGLFPPEYEYVRVSGRGYQTKKVATGRVDESALKPGWKEVYFDLKNSVTEEDMKAIMASTQFAHFTSEKVIRSIWKAVEQFGFKGGKIVEPGMGTGLFMVAAPEQVAKDSRYVGIERDNVTAAIASQLLQGQSVIRNSYIDQNLPDNNFDMAIGNPPFAGWKVLADPRYKKHGFLLHDYFFAKTIDKVRPGGVLVFVTSKGTMDKQDDKARAYLAERADLLGAIRLPQTAFKGNAGTEVVTDVLFLKKREPGAAPSSVAWAGLKEVETPQGPTKVNEYFADHPDMVLGRHELAGSMYRANEYTVTPLEGDIEEHFAKAIERLPRDVYAPAEKIKTGATKAIQQKSDRQEFNVVGKKEGGLYIAEDGELMQVENGVGVPLSNIIELNDKEQAWLRDYVPLRDKLKLAMKDQLEDGNWEASLAELKKAYAAFRKTHGRILEHTNYEREFENEAGDKETRVYKRFKWNKLLKSSVDVEITLVQALEAINENNNEVSDGGILVNGRVLSKRADPEIKTVNDAFAVTLNTLGRLDIGHIAGLLNLSEDEAINQLGDLVYEHPVEGWQTADEYLSGNVLKKLEEAEVAAATDPRFQRNVQALIAVQPAPLGPDRIVIRLGANWIYSDVVQSFTEEALGEAVGVVYEPRTNRWTVEGENLRRNRAAGAEWGTADRSMPEILSSVLNNESITIRRTTEDKKTYVDKDATAKANDVAEKMRQRFANWVWTDAERTENLLTVYNRKFNNLAPRAFDGKHLTLPGLSLRYKLYDHQLRAIWRVVQTGNTYLDHAVGAGKTLEMIVSAMEQKRLGLISKPMFVVPNHMLEQFANEFQEAYPAARILVADKDNFIGDQRRRFVAKAAMNDWDAIIIKQSSFGLIGIKQETADAVADDMLDELKSALDDADKDDRTTRKKLEAQIEQVQQRVDSMVGKGDGNVSFEELGVDFLYVDEAHTYRKLDYATNRQIKGIDPNGSKGAFGMFAKMRYLDQNRPGRSAVMASGTPVTNTIAELYTVQRFMDYAGLREDGLHAFDAWANNFGAVGQEWERNAAGEYEKVERFSKFVNVPELMQRVRKFMDVLTMDQLGQYVQRPALKGGQPQMMTAQKSDALDRYMREVLLPRLEESKKWKPTKEQPYNPDPVIAIGTDGRLAAIDARFAYPSMKDDPGSKLNLMIDQIIDEYKATANNVYTTDGKADKIKGGTQIVFSSVGFGENVEQNRGFSPRKWMLERLKKAGIPSSEVAFMSDYKTDKQKETMFKEMREGKKRILIGSPANMGTGVNVQKRLTSLHFMAPPWYPSDVEQPHGRILRQGNQNKEISIKWYVTEGTYDSTMWGMVRRKGSAIEQAFRGDGSRTVEDISEVSSYAMAEAVAAGDDRVIKLAEAQANVEKYTRLKNAHFTEQRTLRGDVAYMESRARSLRADILRFEQAAAEQKDAGYQWWSELPVTVGGKTFTKPSEVGEQVGNQVAKVFTAAKSMPVAKVMDRFELVAEYSPFSKNYSKKDEVSINLRVGEATVRVTDDSMTLDEWAQQDETGLGQRIKNAMKKIEERLRSYNNDLAEVEKQLAKKRPMVGAPFADESLLAQSIADAAQLQAELVGDSIKRQAAAKQVMVRADGSRWNILRGPYSQDGVSLVTAKNLGDGTTQEIRADELTPEAKPDQSGAGNIAIQGKISPADQAVYGMVAEGKSATDILKFIASASRNPLYRQLAKLLQKTGIAPAMTVGDPRGWKFNAGNDKRYAAAYNNRTNTVALFKVAAAERNVLHELMHAATMKALAKGGLASAQMKALFRHVQQSKQLAGLYGMTDVDEFVAEAFTNPKFQDALKQVSAPKTANTLKSAWQWFVRIVRGIIGLPGNQENALSQAIEIGLGLMRENMAAEKRSPSITDSRQFVPFARVNPDNVRAEQGNSLQEKATNWLRHNVQGKTITNAATGWEISFGRKGINKTMNHAAKDVQTLSVSALPAMMENAVLVKSEPTRHAENQMDIFAVHHFYAPFELGGQAYLARLVVKETRSGQRFYDFNASDVISPAKPAADAHLHKEGAADGNDAGPTMSMATLLAHVKKSHGGTEPKFSATAKDDIRYNITEQASNELYDLFHSDKSFNLLHKTVATQYHKAQVDKDFKKVFDIGQAYLLDTSRFAMDAAERAPNLLQKLESLTDALNPWSGPKRADIEAISHPVFTGTLENTVYTDEQLRSRFHMNDAQISLYREFRDGINKSLDDLGVSEMARISKSLLPEALIEQAKGSNINAASDLLSDALLADMRSKMQEASAAREQGDETKAKELERKALLAEQTAGDVQTKAQRINQLKAMGYAPLMRFGEYTVDAVGPDPETGEPTRLYFSMFESQREANKMARALREAYPDATVTSGIMDSEAWKLFGGIDPSSLEVFAEALGADEQAVYQDFLRLTVNNRSALKRLIKREGIAGFSEDSQRVLAQFVTSNGRMAARNYHFGDMKKAVMDIPQTKGDVRSEAAKLAHYLQNPQEESAPLRGYLFVHFLGGSIASSLVNMTQPITMTAPYLAQFGGAGKAGAALASAAKLYASGNYDPQLAEAMKLAAREGVTEPHEIHQLYAESMRGLGRSMPVRRFLRAWGSFFSLAESFNRKLTFIAAYNMARDNGEANPFAFAQKAVEDTQGIYNKGNRPNWARGSVGATVFTFKQFSIAYIEFLRRLQKNNPQAFALALAIMFIGAGAEGLPFADDIEDLIDTIGHFFGYSTNSKQWLRKNAAKVFGEVGGEVFRKGVSGIPGSPIDISKRVGVQNLIPGTGMFKVSETDKSRDVLEVIGPIGGFATSAIKGFEAARQGDLAGALRMGAPLAMQNAFKAADMMQMGFYRDTNGRKVVDTDGYDAFWKAVGFQPNVVARESAKINEVMQTVNQQRAVEAEVAQKWAEGVFEKDPDKVAAARAELNNWNQKNPDTKILITPKQISDRIRSMTMTREQRFIKSAPPELRGTVMKELAS